MTILSNQAEKCLRQALDSPCGIQILINQDGDNRVYTPSFRAKQILYRFRKEIGDVELQKIQIHLCPSDPDNRLWLIKSDMNQ